MLAAIHIREQINHLDRLKALQAVTASKKESAEIDNPTGEEEPEPADMVSHVGEDGPGNFKNINIGARQASRSIQEVMAFHANDPAFQEFDRRLERYLNQKHDVLGISKPGNSCFTVDATTAMVGMKSIFYSLCAVPLMCGLLYRWSSTVISRCTTNPSSTGGQLLISFGAILHSMGSLGTTAC